MKKVIAALVVSSFLLAGGVSVQAATQSQSESVAANAPVTDQQQVPKKHKRHHKKPQEQTQSATDLNSKK